MTLNIINVTAGDLFYMVESIIEHSIVGLLWVIIYLGCGIGNIMIDSHSEARRNPS